MKQSSKLKSFLTTIAFSLLIVVVFLTMTYRIAEPLTSFENLKSISNAFFLPGFTLVSFGALVIIDNYEGFDFLRYGMMKFWELVRRIKNPEGPKNFYEYRNQASLREKSYMYVPMIIVGLSFVLINVIFWLILNQMYPTS